MISTFMLSDKCNIYHLASVGRTGPTFGIDDENLQQRHKYPDEPDLENVKCYVVETSQSIIQSEPKSNISNLMDFTFAINTDVRLKDILEFAGERYVAQKPMVIKNSHIEVKATRNEAL